MAKKEKKEKEKKDQEEIEEMLNELMNEEPSEESLQKFVSNMDKKIGKGSQNFGLAYIFGILVSRNLLLHFLITLIMNVVIMSALEGYFHLVAFDKLYMFFLGIIAFSVVEFGVKTLLVRFCIKPILKTFGLAFIVLQIGYIELLHFFFPSFAFENQGTLFLFVIGFAFTRYLLTRVSHSFFSNLSELRRKG